MILTKYYFFQVQDYTLTFAPIFFNQKNSQDPLNPVAPVTKTLIFL